MRISRYLLVLVVIVGSSPGFAGSLWSKPGKGATSLFSDTKARRVGDIVTIVIEDAAEITKERDMTTSKSTQSDFEIKMLRLFGLDDASHPRAANDTVAADWEASRDYSGEADANVKDEFNKTLAAIVKEVLPNGNLIIEGVSDMVTDDDITTVTVSGIIRPEDITAANQVSSQRIANAQLNYQSKGPLKQNTRKGWLERIIDIIWPF